MKKLLFTLMLCGLSMDLCLAGLSDEPTTIKVTGDQTGTVYEYRDPAGSFIPLDGLDLYLAPSKAERPYEPQQIAHAL